jgi:hypothetical protein
VPTTTVPASLIAAASAWVKPGSSGISYIEYVAVAANAGVRSMAEGPAVESLHACSKPAREQSQIVELLPRRIEREPRR